MKTPRKTVHARADLLDRIESVVLDRNKERLTEGLGGKKASIRDAVDEALIMWLAECEKGGK